IGIHAVLVVIAIRPVVFGVVRHQIVECEAIMGSQEIHALISVIGLSPVIGEQIVTAVETAHQIGNHSRISLNETANVIPKSPVPLKPGYAGKSAAELKSTCIPGLRNES